jgi:hypothetical protein
LAPRRVDPRRGSCNIQYSTTRLIQLHLPQPRAHPPHGVTSVRSAGCLRRRATPRCWRSRCRPRAMAAAKRRNTK